MKMFFILNDAPYGLERNFNAIKLAGTLAKKDVELKIFLLSDSIFCAKRDQATPQGYYNIETMLIHLIAQNAEIGLCSTCMNAHGMKDEEMIDGAKRSSMDELANWTIWADKVLVF